MFKAHDIPFDCPPERNHPDTSSFQPPVTSLTVTGITSGNLSFKLLFCLKPWSAVHREQLKNRHGPAKPPLGEVFLQGSVVGQLCDLKVLQFLDRVVVDSEFAALNMLGSVSSSVLGWHRVIHAFPLLGRPIHSS
jgi:hypothetical protein